MIYLSFSLLDNYDKRSLPRALTIKILCDIRQPSTRSHFSELEGKRFWESSGAFLNYDLSAKSIVNLNYLCHLKWYYDQIFTP